MIMDDPDQNKVFIGGISWETTEFALKQHFGSYGTVVGSVVAKDRNTGSPRGFGFVSFAEPGAVDRVLQHTHHILGRTVEVKRAIPRSEQNQHHQEQSRGLTRSSRTVDGSTDQSKTKKIFVGGLAASLTEDEFRIYFEQFGRITDVVVMHDSMTHRPRGFGFITFETEDAVEDVIRKNFHELRGKLVEVKKAIPKEICGTNSNGYSTRLGNGRGSDFTTFEHGNPSPYAPRIEIIPSYGPPHNGYSGTAWYPYGASYFGSGYPIGGYGATGYGLMPISTGSPWGGPSLVGVRNSPLPYGSPTVYPFYMNGGSGFVGMESNGYSGVMGAVPNMQLVEVGYGSEYGMFDAAVPSQIGRESASVNALGLAGNCSGETSKQNQDAFGGQLKPCPAGNVN